MTLQFQEQNSLTAVLHLPSNSCSIWHSLYLIIALHIEVEKYLIERVNIVISHTDVHTELYRMLE